MEKAGGQAHPLRHSPSYFIPRSGDRPKIWPFPAFFALENGGHTKIEESVRLGGYQNSGVMGARTGAGALHAKSSN